MTYQELQELKAKAEQINAGAVARIQRDFMARCAAKHDVAVASAARVRALQAVVDGQGASF